MSLWRFLLFHLVLICHLEPFVFLKEETLALRKEGIGVVLDSELPHLIGIDDDLLSTGIILYHLKVRTHLRRFTWGTETDHLGILKTRFTNLIHDFQCCFCLDLMEEDCDVLVIRVLRNIST